jgi:hypothetical protein
MTPIVRPNFLRGKTMNSLRLLIKSLFDVRDKLPGLVQRDHEALKLASLEPLPHGKKHLVASGKLQGKYVGRGRVWTRLDVRRAKNDWEWFPQTRTSRWLEKQFHKKFFSRLDAAVQEAINNNTVTLIEPLLNEADLIVRKITTNARDAVESGSKRYDKHDEPLNDILNRLIRLIPEEKAPPGYATYFRDKFIYESKFAGMSWADIKIEVDKRWPADELSISGLRKAATTYADKMSLKPLPKGKSGSQNAKKPEIRRK